MENYKQKYEEVVKEISKLRDMLLEEEVIHIGGIIDDNFKRIFPELEENKDERIRKALLEYFGEQCDMSDWNGIYGYEVYAWLEKQGKQKLSDIDNKFLRMRETKPANIVEFLDRLTTVEQEFLWEHIEKVKKIDREEREQKPTDKVEPIFNVGDKIQYSKGCGTIMTIEKIENGEYIFGSNMGHTSIESGNKWYLVEQNPAWSEEDETYLNTIVSDLDYSKAIHNKAKCNFIDKEIKWFKSLKDRVIPQSKQEWSGEDEGYYDAIISKLEVTQEDALLTDNEMDFLKSLKERVQPKQEWNEEDDVAVKDICDKLNRLSMTYVGNESIVCQEEIKWLKSLRPQNKWKPSDRQMKALKEACDELLEPEGMYKK